MDSKASIRDGLAAGLRAEGIAVTTDAPLPMPRAGETFGARVFDELERTIPGAHRDARGGLVLDGDAVKAAARRMGRGRQVDRETGEVRDPAREEYRRRYLAVGVDPDAPLLPPEYPRVDRPDGAYDYLHRVESPILADVAAGLIERTGRYDRLAELRIAYLWASDLGSVQGEARLWRWKRPDPLTAWALGTGRAPRAYDLILEADGTVATRAQMTLWQAQALVHTALECVAVRAGSRIQIAPESGRVQQFITARYGQWNATLMGIARALAVAEAGQLPLWDEASEEEGEGDE